jgi:hypothetical protein
MDFVPTRHVAHLVRDTVREKLELPRILRPYEKEEQRYLHHHPVVSSGWA